jgi:hypothetical protein
MIQSTMMLLFLLVVRLVFAQQPLNPNQYNILMNLYDELGNLLLIWKSPLTSLSEKVAMQLFVRDSRRIKLAVCPSLLQLVATMVSLLKCTYVYCDAQH